MEYTPRLKCPSSSSKYYNSNENPFVASGYGMFQNNGNCTCYAWGRFFEILGKRPNLHTGDAGTWYGKTSDGYERGNKPQLGAVACWAKPGQAGHVAIVEKINSDGSILFSNSGWNYKLFYQTTGNPTNYMNSSSYIFQGFIYNPAVKGLQDKLSEFLKVAESHVGENGDWTYKVSGLSKGQPWCAAFVNACAKTVGGVVNVVIPQTYSSSAIPRIGVNKGYGSWIEGPHKGNNVTPQPGDLILFRWSSYSNLDTYDSDHVGIVKDVKNNRIYTIEGNSSNKVSKREYSISDRCINGYYRPNWNEVGSNCLNLVTYKPLYDVVNTREDAIIREVGYIDSLNKPSINLSNIRLSVINYTTPLGVVFNNMIGSSSEVSTDVEQTVITDGLSNVQRTIVEYFMNKGLSGAVGVGIVANVQAECSFNIGQKVMDSNGKYSYGMCMWNGINGEDMVKYVGSNWRTNLSGQLDFLWYDITSRQPNWFNYMYRNIYGSGEFLKELMSIKNTEEGARKAADIFVRCYENPANVYSASQLRQSYASDWWNKLVVQIR